VRSVALTGADPVAEIVSQVEQSIAAYNSAWPSPLDAHLPLALTGEMAGNPDLREAINAKLGRTVATVTSPFQGPVGFNASTFVVNAGLILGVL
jgi:hypothetical protein